MRAIEGLLEMAFDRRIAEQKIRGAEQTINEHLVKLLAFDGDDTLRQGWKKELVRKHFGFLANMRLKPNNRLVPERDFLAWLYGDPFEGNEEGYTAALIRLSDDQYPRNSRTVAEVAASLAQFHSELARSLSTGSDAADLVATL
jgi:hypothetical protein